MKSRYAPLLASILAGLCFWLVDAVMDRYLFYGGSLWGAMLSEVPAPELSMRILGLFFFVGVGALMTRISAKQRRAESILRESEAKYRTLVKDAGDGIALLDVEGNLVEVNKRAEDLLGYPGDELKNRHFRELLPAEERERAMASFETTLRQGAASLSDLAVLRKDGRTVPVDVSASVIEVLGRKTVQAIFRDVSERKQMEEAQQQSEERLRFLSSELLSAQERERGRIARDLHDGVGQSLGSLKVRVEAILKKASQGEGRADLQLVENLIPILRGTMEEVRTISMGLRPSIIDSLGLVATISWFCREFEASHPGIRIEQEIEVTEEEIPEPIKIVIYRILQEAFNNSARHSGGDRLRLSLRREDGRVSLLVGDNGRGFDPAMLSSPRSGAGGLGLVSMRERAELSGGSFSVKSRPEKGTTVKASWPTPS